MSIVDSLRKLSLKLTGAYSTGEDIEDNIEYIAENYSGGGGSGEPSSVLIATIVESLPDNGVEDKLYLVLSDSEEQIYNEYIWSNNVWVDLGPIHVEIDVEEITELKEDLTQIDSYKNIFDGSKITTGVFLRHDTGATPAASGWSVSDYIYVKGFTKICTGYVKHILFYDANKTMISGSGYEVANSDLNVITIPSNAYYIRFDWYVTNLTNYGFTESTIMVVPEVELLPCKYHSYGEHFDIGFSDKTDIVENESTKFKDFTYLNTDGSPMYMNGYATSDYIKVEKPSYTISKYSAYATYDSSKNLIARSGTAATNAVINCAYNKGIAYIRLSVQQLKKDYVENKDDITVVETGKTFLYEADDNY